MTSTNTDFVLLFKSKLDATEVEKDIKEITSKKYTVTIDAKGQESLKETIKYVDQAGNSFQRVRTNLDATGTATSKTTTKISQTTKATQSLGKEFLSTTGKVLKFGASTAAIGLVTSALQEGYRAILEYDAALTEFKKVSDLSGDALDSYAKKLGQVGTEVARTRTEMIEAAGEFVKTGATEEQAASLAKVASLYQNVADSQISAGDAASFITSQMKAFNITTENSEHIIDAVNEVSNKFSVSSTDVATALTKTSGAMAVLGNSFEETIGLSFRPIQIPLIDGKSLRVLYTKLWQKCA